MLLRFQYLLQLASYISLQLLAVHATDLNEYLNEKLRQSKIEFIKIHIQETSPGEYSNDECIFFSHLQEDISANRDRAKSSTISIFLMPIKYITICSEFFF